ncbi:MAG: nuclear transport factor 2 family protein [Pseudomonadota bacterium]
MTRPNWTTCLALGFMCFAIGGAKVAAAADAKGTSVEARLRHIEDVESIRVLLDHYIELNESRDYPAYSQLFAKDGELVLRSGRATGPAGILKMMQETYGKPGAPTPAKGSSHILSNIKITVEGDAATASSRWTLLVPEDDHARLGGTGRYADKLVRENGVWKFQQRVIQRDIPADAPAAAR